MPSRADPDPDTIRRPHDSHTTFETLTVPHHHAPRALAAARSRQNLLLVRIPISFHDDDANKFRHVILEILNRLPNNEVLKPYTTELLHLATEVSVAPSPPPTRARVETGPLAPPPPTMNDT